MENTVWERCFRLLDKEICSFAYVWVDIEEKLVIDEVLNWLVVIIKSKHCIDEWKAKDFIYEMAINSCFAFTDYRWSSRVLTFQKLELNIFHFSVVIVSLQGIVFVCQTRLPIYSEKLYLRIIFKIKILGSTLFKWQICLILRRSVTIIEQLLLNVFDSKIANRPIKRVVNQSEREVKP